MTHTGRPSTGAAPRDDAVGRQAPRERVREEAVLDEAALRRAARRGARARGASSGSRSFSRADSRLPRRACSRCTRGSGGAPSGSGTGIDSLGWGGVRTLYRSFDRLARMDFDFTPEEDAFRAVVRAFAREEIAPHAAEWDQTGEFPTEIVPKMGELGLFGLLVPEDLGGSAASFTTFCVAVEELAAVDSSIAITLSAGVGLGIGPILNFGSDAQRKQWLPDMAAGRALGAFGLTEADAGSDAGSLRTRATLDGDEWVIDGAKEFITNSGTPLTSVITVAARTDDGISAFLVPTDTPGFSVGPAYKKMGWRASDTHALTFDGCRVPHDNLLGAGGRGFQQFLTILDGGRVAIAALALGLTRACLDVCVEYANERNAFGGPIARFQGVSFPLADLAVALESARGCSRTTPPGARTRGCRSDRPPRSPSCRPPRPPSRPGAPPRRSSAGRASSRRPRPTGTTATPRSSRSVKGRARSNGS